VPPPLKQNPGDATDQLVSARYSAGPLFRRSAIPRVRNSAVSLHSVVCVRW
jgi:hypothetical protein